MSCSKRWELYFEIEFTKPETRERAKAVRKYEAHMCRCQACRAAYDATPAGYEVRTDEVIAADSARVLAEAKA